MATPWMPLIVSILILAHHSVLAAKDLPGGVCSVEDQTCEMHGNVVMIVPNIDTMAECRLLCEDEAACRYFTQFGTDSHPFFETCILYSSCSAMQECVDCTTEDGACLPCSSAVDSQLADNLVQYLPDMEKESDCRSACTSDIGCSYYTYHSLADPSYAGACFLLSGLREPIQPCPHCRTGAADCEQRCLFMDGESSTSGVLVTNSTTVKALALGHCELTILAVGGGGYSDYGGGGSGYIEWTTMNLTGPVDGDLQITVGKRHQKTSISRSGGVLVEAQPGSSADSWYGGNGFSGGGAFIDGYCETPGQGGSNGQDGDDCGSLSGGKGSGVDVGSIPIKDFKLMPGNGGLGTGTGGGGGGLLVDGSGPVGGVDRDGQGYGGGSGGGAGKDGVVLLSYK